MSILVEIICLISQEGAQQSVEQHFEQTSDHLLARCAFEELDRVLLVVELSPTTNENEYTPSFQRALQQGIIESYEYVTCYPLIAFLKPSPNRQEQMNSFPLRDGESWFPAFDHPNKVYICLDKPLMTSNQSSWLIKHQARWEYEEM